MITMIGESKRKSIVIKDTSMKKNIFEGLDQNLQKMKTKEDQEMGQTKVINVKDPEKKTKSIKKKNKRKTKNTRNKNKSIDLDHPNPVQYKSRNIKKRIKIKIDRETEVNKKKERSHMLPKSTPNYKHLSK